MRQPARAFTWDTEPADEGPSEFVDTRRLEAASGRKPPRVDPAARHTKRALWKLLLTLVVIVAVSGVAIVQFARFLHN